MADNLSIQISALLAKNTESELQNQLDKIAKKLKLTIKDVQAANQNITKTSTSTNTVATTTDKATQSLSRYAKGIENLIHLYKMKLRTDDQFLKSMEQMRSKVEFTMLSQKKQEQVVRLLAQAEKNYQKTVDENLKAELKKQEAYNKTSAELEKIQKKAQATNEVMKKFGTAEQRQKIENLVGAIQRFNVSQDMTQNELEDTLRKVKLLEAELNGLARVTKATGNNAITFGHMLQEAFKKFAVWSIATVSWYGVVRAIQRGVDAVKELDTSLTELNKVADLTDTHLKNITDRAYEVGTAIGRTGKEVIDATTEFKRAGYDIEEAFELSQQALLLTNIGDGIDDVKEASSSLIAVLRGFKMEAKDTAHIVDALNEVSNNFAVDTNNLTEIMKRVSGTVAQTGTSYEELLGLATGGFETLRNAEMVASGINMISQRLRGMTEDGEEAAELIPKIQEAFDKYTGGAVSVIDKVNGGLHSTYEILEQLAKIYPTLSDEAKAYINEAVAGNRQNKVLVSILENWDNVEKAIESATNSTGSAMRENEKYLKSIEGRISRFASAVQKMWYNTISSDIIKFTYDLGTAIITLVDKIGLLNTALIALVGYFSLFKTSLTFIPIINTATVAISKFTSHLGLAGIEAIRLNTILGMLSPVAVITAILGVVKFIDYLGSSVERQQEKVEELKREYESLNSSLENNEEQLKNVRDRIKELNELKSEKGLSDKEEKELENLKQTTKELERQVEVEKALLDLRKEQLELESLNLAKQKTETSSMYVTGGYTIGLTADEKIQEDIRLIEEYNQKIADLKRQYDEGKIVAERYSATLEKLKNERLKHVESLNNLKKKLLEEKDSYTGVTKAGKERKAQIEELIDAIDDLIIKTNETQKGTEDLNDEFKKNAPSIYKNRIEEATEAFQKQTEKVKELVTIRKELDSVDGLSAKSMELIITKHQELLPYLDDQAELRRQLIELIQKEENAQREAYANMLMESESFYNAKVKGNAELINKLNEYYKHDLSNYSSLAEAKEAIEVKLLNSISSKWAKYYDAVNKTYSQAYISLSAQATLGDKKAQRELTEMMNDPSWRKLIGLEDHFKSLVGSFTSSVDFSRINLGDLTKNRGQRGESQRGENYVDQVYRSLPTYIERIDDVQAGLEEIEKTIVEIGRKIEMAEALEETERVLKLKQEQIGLYQQERKLISAATADLRKIQKEISDAFWTEGLGKRIGRHIENLTQEDIARFDELIKKEIIRLENKAGSTASQKTANAIKRQIDALKYRQDLFHSLIEAYDYVGGEIAKNIEREFNAAIRIIDIRTEFRRKLEELADEVVDMHKKMYEEMKKAAIKAIDDEMKVLEKAHKRKMEQLDEELKRHEDIINARIKMLDREAEEEDYQRKLNKLQKERQEIINKINILSLDDSLEARLQLSQLNEELLKKDEEIEVFKTERSRELRRQNLQDQLESKRKEIEQERKSAEYYVEINNERFKGTYEKAKEWLDKQREYTEKHWNNIINNERTYKAIRENIMKGYFEEVKKDLQGFFDFLDTGSFLAGEAIKNNLIDAIDDILKRMNNLSPLQEDVEPTYMGGDGHYYTIRKDGSVLHVNPDTGNYEIIEDDPELIAALRKKGIRIRHTGGLADLRSGNRITNLVDKLFNTKPNEVIVKALRDELFIPSQNILNNFIPNMRNLIGSFPSIPVVAGGGDVNYDVRIYIDKLTGDRDGANVLIREFMKGLKKKGGRV